MKCQACNAAEAQPRELWMQVGAVEMGVRASLCDVCATTAPERIRQELSSPLIKSLLMVAGARIGFPLTGGTAAAATPPGNSA